MPRSAVNATTPCCNEYATVFIVLSGFYILISEGGMRCAISFGIGAISDDLRGWRDDVSKMCDGESTKWIVLHSATDLGAFLDFFELK